MNVLFVVVVPFPFGDASSIRAYNLCKLMNDTGIRVHVISDYPPSITVDKKIDFCTYEDCQASRGNTIAQKSLRMIESYLDTHKVDAVLSNARYDRYDALATICHKRHIDFYVENCEWYDSTSFKLGKLDPRFWKNEAMIRCGFRKADGFISISRLLDQHNQSFGKVSVRIPTILDVINTEWSCQNENEKIQIVYAGSLGKSKELLRPIIQVMANYEIIRNRINMHIYGPSKTAVCDNIHDNDILDKLTDSVYIHGRVPQTQVPQIMKDADFVFFMRPDRQSSHAGFPTKLGESMAVGTPVITNNTGDILEFIKPKENGIIISGLSDDCVYQSLLYIVNMTLDERIKMRTKARKTAEKVFDYRQYRNEIKELFHLQS